MPLIKPAVDFLVFQMGSTFNLICEIGSGWNITWKISTSEEEKISTTLIQWTTSLNGQITATLTIRNAGYFDTGYYTCQRSDNNKNFAVKQFVFVQGTIVSMNLKKKLLI